MINIDGIEYRTAAQWEKKRRHVLKGQLKKGVERSWRSPNGNETMMFYSVEQTRPWAKKDVEAVNRRRRADAKAKRDAEECERIEGGGSVEPKPRSACAVARAGAVMCYSSTCITA